MSQPPVPTPAPEPQKPTPTPPEPSRPTPPQSATIEAITVKPWWMSRTLWASVAAFALALPDIIRPIVPLIPEKYSSALMGLAVFAATVAAWFARKGGVEAAGAALEISRVEAKGEKDKARADSLRWGRTPGG